ncbi:MAG: RIP metalloprotease RseP [Burkholderiales bacterium PBB3]|nr:MAG: RIP metalloprotease RseP [Burkholderiales bacterium PBB3]
MLFTIASFLIAIAILVAVHEFGHFATAVALRVKVLCFSIGFGPRLVTWQSKRLGTEFAISLLPLGGYVKFLDERDGPVDVADRPFAFNVQPLKVRAAIVAGGPVANFLLAIVLYACVNWVGTMQPSPLLSTPIAGSVAERAGIRGGDLVVAGSSDGQEPVEIQSFEDFRWLLMRSAIDHQDLSLDIADSRGGNRRQIVLPLAALEARDADAALFRKIGILAPLSVARLGVLAPGGAAEEAGLKAGDLVLQVDGTTIVDAAQLRDIIRSAVGPAAIRITQAWRIDRSGTMLTLPVSPRIESAQGARVGRVGAYIGVPPAMVMVRYGGIAGLTRAMTRTWEVSVLSLQMIGKILVGEASLKNLSGPITIADYAGQSASLGAVPFVVFLALISVSLGVLNLLPLPVLDGGHLMYYLWESLTGKPVSESWMEQLQKVGLVVLLMMMSVAVFNDVTRLLG